MILPNAVPWRLVGYVAVSAVLIVGGWWIGQRLERAAEADRLEAELANTRAAVARERAAAAAYAKQSADARAAEAALAARIAQLPTERLVYVRTPTTGRTTAPDADRRCERLSADFVRAYNDAVTGSAR